jgi:hypothetical protein
MKTEAPFHYSNFPLKIAEDNKSVPQQTPLRIIEKNDFRNQRFAFIDNKAIEDSANWDASWFTNYE